MSSVKSQEPAVSTPSSRFRGERRGADPVGNVVILAAGQGIRLRKNSQDYLKPLYPVNGHPLIVYVMESFAVLGIKHFTVVVGFEKDEMVAGLKRHTPRGYHLEIVENNRWDLSNGISLLAAKEVVKERFFLSMSDHLFQPAIPYALHNGAQDRESLYLAVDKKIKRIFDLDDATKVKSREGRIVDIGKTIPEYDAVDTGLFICPPGIFEALEGAQVRGDCSLSDGVRAMAERGRARTVDIGGAFWQDVDTPEMLNYAQSWLNVHQLHE